MEQRWMPAERPVTELVEESARRVPAWVAEAGDAARFAFEEFFYRRIRNPHMRKAYLHVNRRVKTGHREARQNR